jgi:hypothetical protein
MRKKVVRTKQLDAHSRVYTRSGVTVAVRTLEIVQPMPRYELILEGKDQRAVVDLPGSESEIDLRIEEAVSAFVACEQLRASQA